MSHDSSKTEDKGHDRRSESIARARHARARRRGSTRGRRAIDAIVVARRETSTESSAETREDARSIEMMMMTRTTRTRTRVVRSRGDANVRWSWTRARASFGSTRAVTVTVSDGGLARDRAAGQVGTRAETRRRASAEDAAVETSGE